MLKNKIKVNIKKSNMQRKMKENLLKDGKDKARRTKMDKKTFKNFLAILFFRMA